MSKSYKLLPLLTFIFCLSIWCPLLINAATVDGLYEAIVPVDGYRSANSKQVLTEGMQQVLIKVTGNRDIADHPNIKQALSMPENYLIKYTQKIIETNDEMTQEDVGVKTKQLVSVQNYSFERILDLLKTSDIPVWGKQRPLTLAWIAIEFGPRNRVILNESDVTHFNNVYKDIITNEANKRGVPLAYPLQDLEEQISLSSAAIWAQFPDELRAASIRYGADIIIAGSLQAKDENTWHGRWQVIGKDNTIEFTTEAYQLTVAIQQGINWLADTLAKMYTTHLAAPTEWVKVKIEGVDSLADYNKLDKYLTSLSVVDDVKLLRIGKDSIDLAIQVKQGKKNLLTALELDSRLVGLKTDVVAKNLAEHQLKTDALSFEAYDSQVINTVEDAAQGSDVMKFRWRS